MKTLLLASLFLFPVFGQAQTPIFKTASFVDYVSVNNPLNQVVLAKIKPEHADEFKKIVTSLLPRLRAQAGNISYNFSQNHEDPTEFVFYENWINGLSIKNHMQSKLIEDFFAQVGTFFEPGFPQMFLLEKQGVN